MSTDIMIHFFKNGDDGRYPRALIEDVFSKYISSSDETYIYVDFPGYGTTRVNIGKKDPTTGLAVNRPPYCDEFWECILDIMRRTGGTLIWPGGWQQAMVADASFLSNVPRDFIEAGLGEPVVVTSVDELLDAAMKPKNASA